MASLSLHAAHNGNCNMSSVNYNDKGKEGDDVETGTALNQSESEETASLTPSLSSPQSYSERRARIFSALIVLVGIFSCSLFLGLGITLAEKKEEERFTSDATELVKEIESAWSDYEMACLMLHRACRSRQINRTEFRELYLYLRSSGVDFQAAEFVPNVTHAERAALEQESREYFQENFPNITYQGIQGFEPAFAGRDELTIQNRSVQDFYFPVHLLEPIEGNEAAIDLDMYSSESRRMTIESALQTWKPSLSTRLTLVQEMDRSAFSVLLMHPGIPLDTDPDLKPRDLALLGIRIPALILRAIDHLHAESTSLYIFDSTGDPLFLGGAWIDTAEDSTVFMPETNLTDVRKSKRRMLESTVPIASRQWTIVVVALEGSFEGDNTLVIVGAIMILVACVSLALFVFSSMRRVNSMNKIKSQNEAEKAALLIESAKKAAIAERELNDYIAHEIRNPVSAAMAAVSFVTSAVNMDPPLADAESQQSVREDMFIVQSSLKYVNDLLRSMLDMHRAASNQMKLNFAPTDILKDVLEPVSSMLYCRGDNFEVTVDCPKNLIVSTDRLRLTQVILNLGRNSSKFVIEGFIRLRASVVDGNVQLCVEDSGMGIPLEKREQLFHKFQDSLDSLSQGTGIGLCLCQNLVELMKADIFLDESFDSGINGYPGTRFVIDLNVPPLKLDLDVYEAKDQASEEKTEQDAAPPKLPENLSVLFVDDDLVLRKLFSRALKRVQPGWRIQEAANGETALDLVDHDKFNLVFMDQYMSGVEKQLLGTETTVAMRAKGIRSIICGLSANDMKTQFINAGADYFMLKPIPTEKGALKRELGRIVCSERQREPSSSCAPPREESTETSGSGEFESVSLSQEDKREQLQ